MKDTFSSSARELFKATAYLKTNGTQYPCLAYPLRGSGRSKLFGSYQVWPISCLKDDAHAAIVHILNLRKEMAAIKRDVNGAASINSQTQQDHPSTQFADLDPAHQRAICTFDVSTTITCRQQIVPLTNHDHHLPTATRPPHEPLYTSSANSGFSPTKCQPRPPTGTNQGCQSCLLSPSSAALTSATSSPLAEVD